HRPFVDIDEALAAVCLDRALDRALDLASDEARLLHRDGAHAGQRRFFTFRDETRGVADHEHLWMAGDGAVGLDERTAQAIGGDADAAAQVRSLDPRRPQHGRGFDAVVTAADAARVDGGDAMFGAHFDA